VTPVLNNLRQLNAIVADRIFAEHVITYNIIHALRAKRFFVLIAPKSLI